MFAENVKAEKGFMKKILTLVLCAVLVVNLVLLHVLSGVRKDLEPMAVQIQRIDRLQSALLEKMDPVEQFVNLTLNMKRRLVLSQDNTQKMKVISQSIEKKNMRMRDEEAEIDRLTKDVVRLLPAAAKNSGEFLQNTRDLQNLMQGLKKTQGEIIELQTALLKMTKKRHRTLKRIPDSGFFF